MATVDKFTMCSRALVLVGGVPISSFAGSDAQSVVASTLYEPTIVDLLSRYRWRFATYQAQLTRRGAAPLGRYDAAYDIPAETSIINALTIVDQPIEFDRYQDSILCNATATDVVIADLTTRVGEAYWPPYFQTLVMFELASQFSVPIAEDPEKAAYYAKRAQIMFAQAKTTDAQGRTARKLVGVGNMRSFHGGRP